MGKRVDVIRRAFAFLWVWFVGAILVTILGTVGLIWMVIDWLWQLVAGTDGLSAQGTVASWVRGTITWAAEQTNYALTGAGGLRLVPSPA